MHRRDHNGGVAGNWHQESPAKNNLLSIRSIVLTAILASTAADAVQVDIPGPPGSTGFGDAVAVLPNGNIVIVDDDFLANDVPGAGAVYLYDPQPSERQYWVEWY